MVRYDVAKGHLLLEHAYPSTVHPVPQICVDVTLVLENTESSIFQTGAWINVIGYTQGTSPRTRKKRRSSGPLRENDDQVSLQAILAWDAGALRVKDWEETIEEQRLVRRQLESKRK